MSPGGRMDKAAERGKQTGSPVSGSPFASSEMISNQGFRSRHPVKLGFWVSSRITGMLTSVP